MAAAHARLRGEIAHPSPGPTFPVPSSMKSPFGFRLWILIGALLLVATGTIAGLSLALDRVEHLESGIKTSRRESFRIAGEIQRRLLNLNLSMLRYAVFRDPREWTLFEQAGNELNRWIDEHDPNLNPRSTLTSETEHRLLRELNQACDDYLAAAQVVHSSPRPAPPASAPSIQPDQFDAQATRMSELAGQLADAHRAAEDGFLAGANAALSHLRGFLTAGVVLLLGLVGTLGWVIYRDLIAPLRIRLVQREALLERQEKLATLGTLAAGIAHEIRNPLTSLKARLYTLEKHLQAAPAARKDTEIIGAEISRLERIVQEVLSFARPADPRLQSMAADSLLREVHGLMAADLESRGVELKVESPTGLFIQADSGHLKQVLINLVRNGAEAIEGRGTVTLRARPGQLQANQGNREAVVLEVSDSGKGIAPEAERRLFDPFFSTKETGTGLGLPIAARIVERHGGLLQYQTCPGHGTTFGVVLPRDFPQTDAGAQRDPDPLLRSTPADPPKP